MNKTCIILVICLIANCTSRHSQKFSDGTSQKQLSEEIPIIDVEKAIASATKFCHLSDIAERIEYIPLEFTPKCAIGSRTFQVYIASEDIFILTAQSGSNDLFRFDKTGKFLNVIGKLGRGPGEYFNALYFAVDTTMRQVYVNSGSNLGINVYAYEGNYVQTLKKDYTHSAPFYFFPETNELAHIGEPPVFYPDDPDKFFVSITDTDNNRIFHKKYLLSSMISQGQRAIGHFSSFQSDNGLLLIDAMSDTLFVYNQYKLSPYFILNYGRYKVTLDAILSSSNGHREALDPYINAIDIVGETSQFLFLRLSQGNGKRNYLLQYDKHSQEYTAFKVKKEEDNPAELFYNDIDGGLPVIWRFPRYNQLARIIDAYDMKETLTAEYFSKSEAKNLHAKERLKNLVQSLGDEDNPVIMKIILK